jgi:hypothetical protein
VQQDLELELAAEWPEVGRINQAAAEYLESLELPPECVSRYTMIVCELVENGIKYGDFSGKQDGLVVRVAVAERTITIQVSNPVDLRSSPYLQELDRAIQWVRGFQDPFEAFLGRIREISREPVEASKSGLGIMRIMYEGRAALDFYLDESRALNVFAVSTY